MGFFSIAKGAFQELARDPVLFLPKLFSVTIFLYPYLLLAQATAEVARNPAAAQSVLGMEFTALAIILALTPIYLFIDSLYPVLVLQKAKTGKRDFKAAARHVWKRFLRILAFFFLLSLAMFAASLPFMLLIALGAAGALPFLCAGVFGIILLTLAAGILLYFTPTALILDDYGILSSFREGMRLSRQNFSLVFWLTLLSFIVLFLGFYAEGALEGLGVIGFIAGRYIGGILTVYLYVINPSAYLEVKSVK